MRIRFRLNLSQISKNQVRLRFSRNRISALLKNSAKLFGFSCSLATQRICLINLNATYVNIKLKEEEISWHTWNQTILKVFQDVKNSLQETVKETKNAGISIQMKLKIHQFNQKKICQHHQMRSRFFGRLSETTFLPTNWPS